MEKRPHILNSASNLLGICLLIITGLKITKNADKTLSDEVAWVGALCFASSCLLSYLSLRSTGGDRLENLSDKIFLAGLLTLLLSVAVLWTTTL